MFTRFYDHSAASIASMRWRRSLIFWTALVLLVGVKAHAGVEADVRSMAVGDTLLKTGRLKKTPSASEVSILYPKTWNTYDSQEADAIDLDISSRDQERWVVAFFSGDRVFPPWNKDITEVDPATAKMILPAFFKPDSKVIESRFAIKAGLPCIEIEGIIHMGESKMTLLALSYNFPVEGGLLTFLCTQSRVKGVSNAELSENWVKSKILFDGIINSMRIEKGAVGAESKSSNGAGQSLLDLMAGYEKRETRSSYDQQDIRREVDDVPTNQDVATKPRSTEAARPSPDAGSNKRQDFGPTTEKINYFPYREYGMPAFLSLALAGLVGWLAWKLR